MIRILLISLLILVSSFANESLILQKQNILYIQKLIDKEEKIAQSFENYLLTEFAIPSLIDLQKDEYLGENFSIKNMMAEGDNLVLDASAYQIKLKFNFIIEICTEIIQKWNLMQKNQKNHTFGLI